MFSKRLQPFVIRDKPKYFFQFLYEELYVIIKRHTRVTKIHRNLFAAIFTKQNMNPQQIIRE